ncbi:protein PML-like [Mytilus californianus]|uniref:protein PML-like n=1 Tax=Mytilus californianus TaxID=6549 RepID=UPI002246C793|nr:protein PML-like [Mytilus californianus]XP_052084632.1 protein PML-like [Mytilus californianus]XP_052084642.1 protein PML-like [Mytilus californianus]XP_052084652.1 protein PML-like [Mytilus californianus]
MATANLEECENICVELLHCTQCEKRYDQSSHQPRILPCLHTICTDCLMKHFQSNSLTCTVCQKSVDIKDTFESSKDTFPIDFTIRDRIEFIDTLNENKNSICDFCDESNTATYRCKDCESYICKTCIRFHNKSSKFKNHVTCNLSEALGVSEFSHEVFCTKDGHENRPLDIFCTGDGCKRPICSMCFYKDHSDSGDHQAKNVQDVFILEMERIFDKYKETEELGHGISEVRKRIKDEMSAIKHIKETEQDKLNEFFAHCHKLLESRQKVLTQKLDTEIELKCKALALQEEEIDSFQDNILTSKVFLQQSSLSKNAPAFLASVSSVDKQLDKIKETEFGRHSTQIANMKFIEDREQSEQMFEHLGILMTTTAVPYTSEIENPKIMYAKTNGMFEVRLKDNRGRPVKDQSIYMEISFSDENQHKTFPFSDTVSGANGCFKAICVLNNPGTYQADIVINGATFFKIDRISCLGYDPAENSSDFVSENQIEKSTDEVVYETFHHKGGREFQCIYVHGMRFYLDEWAANEEWQPFPQRWYQEGLLISNTVLKS